MTKIHNIYIENIKAVDQFDLPLEWATVVLTWGNNRGKSTILCSMIDRLRWEKPDMILRDTTKNGIGTIELTDGNKFTWLVTPEGKEELMMNTSDGRSFKATKDVNEIYFPKVFDIDVFLNKTPREQLKDIKAITWLDLDIIEAEYKEAFDYRAIMKKVKNEAEAKRLPIDFWLPEDELSTEELVREVSTTQAHNEKVDMVAKQRQDKKDRIVRLQEEINQLSLQEEQDFVWLKQNPKRATDTDTAKKLEELRETNRLVDANKKAKALEADYQEALENYEKSETMVADLFQAKLDQIAKANLPKWFTIDDWSLLYNWLPLNRSQQSSSWLYIAWLKLAKEMLWEVKTLHFDASFLDKNSLNDIRKWSQEQDLQLMIERPDYESWPLTYKFLKS